ncbi:UNVERIFIED_CONTAM: Glucosidase 2 subunit beta [Sesamum latifolium]|uniref:Glucosidase 2 subunit beta n=1 Tax=Sesamum latifolium TaxID=2727402 RepID=A0AAW2Y4F2_9LAMI
MNLSLGIILLRQTLDKGVEGVNENAEQLGEASTVDAKLVFETGESDETREDILQVRINTNPDETPDGTNYEDDNGYDTEDDAILMMMLTTAKQEHLGYTSLAPPGLTGEIRRETVKSILRAVNLFQTPVNISDAAHVRKEYDDPVPSYPKCSQDIKTYEEAKTRFWFNVSTFIMQDRRKNSIHSMVMFTKSVLLKKLPKRRVTVQLVWGAGEFEDSYRTMQFLNGDKCWNGPDRSLKVKLRCGLKNEITDVDEPSRCEYVALLATPALCVDSKLKSRQIGCTEQGNSAGTRRAMSNLGNRYDDEHEEGGGFDCTTPDEGQRRVMRESITSFQSCLPTALSG